MAVFRKITDLRAGADFLRFSRYTRKPFPVHMACSVPEKGVSGTEYPFGTTEACFEHGGLLKTRRVHQEAIFCTEYSDVEPLRIVNCFQIFYLTLFP